MRREPASREILAQRESDVLAALSWVWDAQQRDEAWRWTAALEGLAEVLRRRGVEPTTFIMSPRAYKILHPAMKGGGKSVVGDLIKSFSVKILDGRVA